MSKAASNKEWVSIQIHTTPNGGTTLDSHGQTRPPNSTPNSTQTPNPKTHLDFL